MLEPLTFARLYGWKLFSEYLASVGIKMSPAALERRRRRYDLPPRGGARGQVISVTPADVSVWLVHLVGVELDLWIAQHRRDRKGRLVVNSLPRLPRGPALSSRGRALPRRLYAATGSSRAFGEQVLRDPNGTTYCAVSAETFQQMTRGEDWARFTEQSIAVWNYDYARRSTAADLHAARYDHRKVKDRPATSLVAAFEWNGTNYRYIRARGPFFGLPEKTWTKCVASNRLPRFAEMVVWINKYYKECIWVTFTRRAEVNPVTLEIRVPMAPSVEQLAQELPESQPIPEEDEDE